MFAAVRQIRRVAEITARSSSIALTRASHWLCDAAQVFPQNL